MPLVNINTLMQEQLGGAPNFLSIDTEGLDLGILKTMDFDRYRPDVICVETLEVGGDAVSTDILRLLESKRYRRAARRSSTRSSSTIATSPAGPVDRPVAIEDLASLADGASQARQARITVRRRTGGEQRDWRRRSHQHRLHGGAPRSAGHPARLGGRWRDGHGRRLLLRGAGAGDSPLGRGVPLPVGSAAPLLRDAGRLDLVAAGILRAGRAGGLDGGTVLRHRSFRRRRQW